MQNLREQRNLRIITARASGMSGAGAPRHAGYFIEMAVRLAGLENAG
jgi:hypothetical protein